MRYIIGADPGVTGGFVVLKDGRPVKKLMMPRVGSEYDYNRVRRFLKHYQKKDAIVYYEQLHGRGCGWGAKQNFRMGRSYELIKASCAMTQIRHIEITPGTWQKIAFKGVSVIWKKAAKKKKKDTKAMALVAFRKLFPKFDVSLPGKRAYKQQDGLVDAALIAYYGDLEQKGLLHG